MFYILIKISCGLTFLSDDDGCKTISMSLYLLENILRKLTPAMRVFESERFLHELQ